MKERVGEHIRPRERGGRGAVTILQIAERLNLSHSTVSRVLNNKPHTYISEDTRHRVLAVAREMGYRPNLAARSLRDASSNMIGIFASPDIGVWSGAARSISHGLSEVLHARQMHLFFALVTADEDERALPAWRFDGAVLLQQPSEASIHHLLTVDRPFVAVNEQVEHGVSILSDEASGVAAALDHLWELGHRRVAYAGCSSDWHYPHYSVPERRDAYASYLTARGEEPVPGYNLWSADLPTVGADRPSDRRVAWLRQAVLDRGATAVLAYDHVVALEVLAAAQQLLLRVPQDLSLICFNDDFVSSRIYPPLTVVALQGERIGRCAGQILLQRMDAQEGARLPEDSSIPSIVRVPETLIVRDSTAPAKR